MTRAIRSTISPRVNVTAAFGFGSFFRAEQYNDVDVLLVVDTNIDELLQITKALRSDFQSLGRSLDIIFDLKIFTSGEFLGRPLQDMASLYPIYVRD